MLSFFLFLHLCLSWATCSFVSSPALSRLAPSEIPQLKTRAKGCLTLIELWATWCTSCRKSKPLLMELSTEQEHLLHLSISVDYKKKPLSDYLNKRHYPSENVFHMPYWGLEELRTHYAEMGGEFAGAIPFVILLNQDGEILYQETEAKNYDALRLKIAEYLNQ